MFDRGFTGHEYLYGFDLINMNGRMYDPVMSSFLSVDNYVQEPDNSQSFNRYAYCFNNPLRYTDPSGEVAVVDDIIAAAIVGAIINGFVQTASGNVQNFGQWCLATAIGGVAGAAGAWAGGSAAGTLGGCSAGMVGGAAGGAVGGFINGAGNAWSNGASFSEGFGVGLIGSGTGALCGAISGGLTRGIGAWNKGYSFWNGTKVNYFMYDGIPLQYSEKISDDEYLCGRVKKEFSIEEGDLGLYKITTSYKTNFNTKNPITSMDEYGLYIHANGKKSAGFNVAKDWGHQELHISPYATGSETTTFKEIVGHELIHVFHNYTGIYLCNNELNELYSERVAWTYSFMTQFINGNLEKSFAILTKQIELGYSGFYPPHFVVPSHYKFSLSWLLK